MAVVCGWKEADAGEWPAFGFNHAYLNVCRNDSYEAVVAQIRVFARRTVAGPFCLYHG